MHDIRMRERVLNFNINEYYTRAKEQNKTKNKQKRRTFYFVFISKWCVCICSCEKKEIKMRKCNSIGQMQLCAHDALKDPSRGEWKIEKKEPKSIQKGTVISLPTMFGAKKKKKNNVEVLQLQALCHVQIEFFFYFWIILKHYFFYLYEHFDFVGRQRRWHDDLVPFENLLFFFFLTTNIVVQKKNYEWMQGWNIFVMYYFFFFFIIDWIYHVNMAQLYVAG